MIPVFNIGLSAIKAFGQKMETIAENVANSSSKNYKKRWAHMESQGEAGVSAHIEIQRRPNDAVELCDEIPQTIFTQRCYEANLKTLETADEMSGILVDIVG